jgi:hypothetical protein
VQRERERERGRESLSHEEGGKRRYLYLSSNYSLSLRGRGERAQEHDYYLSWPHGARAVQYRAGNACERDGKVHSLPRASSVIVIVIANQDSTSSRLLPGSSYSVPQPEAIARTEIAAKRLTNTFVRRRKSLWRLNCQL